MCIRDRLHAAKVLNDYCEEEMDRKGKDAKPDDDEELVELEMQSGNGKGDGEGEGQGQGQGKGKGDEDGEEDWDYIQATIYNWKTGSVPTDEYEWHIGGHNYEATDAVQYIISNNIKAEYNYND
mgnify:CR=1 FL=1